MPNLCPSHQKYVKKSKLKQRAYFDHRNSQIKIRGSNMDFSTIEMTSTKVRGNNVDFLISEITSKKYVEITWVFRPSKLHRKRTRKWRGNSSKSGLRRIDVISTSNQRGFDVLCPLGLLQKCSIGTSFWKVNAFSKQIVSVRVAGYQRLFVRKRYRWNIFE